jgi:hydrogenase expression/formation protein HypC
VCLAVPLKVERFVGASRAVAGETGSEIEIEIDVSMVPGVKLGDYVIVHAGFAIQIVEAEDAEERVELFRQIAEAANEGP